MALDDAGEAAEALPKLQAMYGGVVNPRRKAVEVKGCGGACCHPHEERKWRENAWRTDVWPH